MAQPHCEGTPGGVCCSEGPEQKPCCSCHHKVHGWGVHLEQEGIREKVGRQHLQKLGVKNSRCYNFLIYNWELVFQFGGCKIDFFLPLNMEKGEYIGKFY